jgi:hypothetical protein
MSDLHFTQLKVEYKIIGENSIYPSKENNAYKVEVTKNKKDKGYVAHHFPKVEYQLIEHLKTLLPKIGEKEMRKLIDEINDFTEYHSEEATFDATYDG